MIIAAVSFSAEQGLLRFNNRKCLQNGMLTVSVARAYSN